MASKSGFFEFRLLFHLIIILCAVGFSQHENSIRQQRLSRFLPSQERISSKHQATRTSKWYLKWLALQTKKSVSKPKQPPEIKDPDIQSDVPGCRDDLCIEDEVEPDYFDQTASPKSLTSNPKDVICPAGFVSIVRDGIIYCDVIQSMTEKTTEKIICADNEKEIITNEGTKCVQEIVSTPAIPTRKTKENESLCKSGQKVSPENGGKCIDKESSKRNQLNDPKSVSPLDAKSIPNKNNTDCKTGEIIKTGVNGQICVAKETLVKGSKHADLTQIPVLLTSPDPISLSSPSGQEASLTERSQLSQVSSTHISTPETRSCLPGQECESVTEVHKTSEHVAFDSFSNKPLIVTDDVNNIAEQATFANPQYGKRSDLSKNSHLHPLTDRSGHPARGKRQHYRHPIGGKHVPVFKGKIPLFNIPGLAGNNFPGKRKKPEINSLHRKISNIKIGRPIVGKKLSACGQGKVLVDTPNGSVCIDPVFPEGVCPPDRVPYLSPMEIQCLPCPFGQNVVKVDRGIKCVTSKIETTTFASATKENGVLNLCPDGLLPFDTPGGRGCRNVSQPVPTKTMTCDSGEEAVIVDGKFLCQTQNFSCPPGQVPLVTETGKKVCGFDVTVQRKNCDDRIAGDCLITKPGQDEDNICPPGLEVVRLRTGEITCRYISMKQTQSPTVEPSVCVSGEILTHNLREFTCQPEENFVGDLRPVCSNGLIVAKFGPNYDCITAIEASLLCQENEELVRQEAGFVCVELFEGSIVTSCAPEKVVFLDQNGRVQCLSLMEAGALCGDGMIAVKSGDGFICKQHNLDLNCPIGYQLRLVQGVPTCVSTTGPDCGKIDGILSTLCLIDLQNPDQLDLNLEFDNLFEQEISCGEGQITRTVDGKLICSEAVGKPTGEALCQSDGVRPCDLDLDILLEGCNPDCANGGTCVNGKCICPPGITGIACSEDVDECLSLDGSVCEHICENIFGGYKCICPVGKVLGSDGHSCHDIGCIPDCLNGGQCMQGMCQCPRGFDGEYCQTDKDECSRYGDRLCQYYCRNTYGGYQCICPPGSRLNVDQRTCVNTTCIPECRNGGSCENHVCFCPPGFYGFVCQLDINECYKQDPCQHECVNTWGSYQCLCRDGYRLAPDRHSCVR